IARERPSGFQSRFAGQVQIGPAADQVVRRPGRESRIGLEPEVTIHSTRAAAAGKQLAGNESPSHRRRLGQDFNQVRAAPDGGAQFAQGCEAFDGSEAHPLAFVDSGCRDRPRLKEPDLTAGDRPLDVTGVAVNGFDLAAKLRELCELFVGQAKCALPVRWYRFATLPSELRLLCPGLPVADLSAVAVDLKSVRGDESGPAQYTGAPRGFHAHERSGRVERVAGEQAPGYFRVHKPLDDDGHRQLFVVHLLALPVGLSAIRVQRPPTLLDRGTE